MDRLGRYLRYAIYNPMNRWLTGLAATMLLGGVAQAQPTWRFHLAFENGDGTRDTIWLVFDTTAFQGPPVDDALGEGRVDMDPDEFNVWMYNALGDSTKTMAWPYSWFPTLDAQINAFNWQAPVTIRWDTTLFHAPYLPGPDSIGLAVMEGEHFFFYNNDPPLHGFNMLIDDSVVVDDPNEIGLLFPFYVGFASHNDLGVATTTPAEMRPSTIEVPRVPAL